MLNIMKRYPEGNVAMAPSAMMYLGVKPGPVNNVLYVPYDTSNYLAKHIIFNVVRVAQSILGFANFKVTQLFNGDIFLACSSASDADALDGKVKNYSYADIGFRKINEIFSSIFDHDNVSVITDAPFESVPVPPKVVGVEPSTTTLEKKRKHED